MLWICRVESTVSLSHGILAILMLLFLFDVWVELRRELGSRYPCYLQVTVLVLMFGLRTGVVLILWLKPSERN